MDFLNGITEELRGRGESNVGTDRSGRDATPDAGRDSATDADPERSDDHVCDFCGTDFDASRGTCPDCGAEIIFRGRR